MEEDDIARLLQNAGFEEILPEERNADGTSVSKQQIKDFIDQQKKKTNVNVNCICIKHDLNIFYKCIFKVVQYST